METPSRNELLDVVEPINPRSWKAYNLTVVADGFLPDGTRVHLVSEKLEKQPTVIANSLVISAEE